MGGWAIGGAAVTEAVLLGGSNMLAGSKTGGRCLGREMLFLLNTTRCMAVQNSLKDRAPSLVTSLNCLSKHKQVRHYSV